MAAEEASSSNITGIKFGIMALVILAGCNVFFPYLPCLKDADDGSGKKKKKACCKGKFFAFTNCFAAGMLLTMAVVHILPESVEMYKTYLESTL